MQNFVRQKCCLSAALLARSLCLPQLLNAGKDLSTFKEEEFQDHFEATYEDIWEEVTKYGEVSRATQRYS